MTKPEVAKYLLKRGVSTEFHEKIYDFIGGRAYHLKKFSQEFISKKLPFEGTIGCLTIVVKDAYLKQVGVCILDHWESIEEEYRPICKNVISFALGIQSFDRICLKRKISTGWWGKKLSLSKAVQLLVKANILSKLGDGTYTIHSKVEQKYLASNIHELL